MSNAKTIPVLQPRWSFAFYGKMEDAPVCPVCAHPKPYWIRSTNYGDTITNTPVCGTCVGKVIGEWLQAPFPQALLDQLEFIALYPIWSETFEEAGEELVLRKREIYLSEA